MDKPRPPNDAEGFEAAEMGLGEILFAKDIGLGATALTRLAARPADIFSLAARPFVIERSLATSCADAFPGYIKTAESSFLIEAMSLN